jgi:hypothetical protein
LIEQSSVVPRTVFEIFDRRPSADRARLVDDNVGRLYNLGWSPALIDLGVPLKSLYRSWRVGCIGPIGKLD